MSLNVKSGAVGASEVVFDAGDHITQAVMIKAIVMRIEIKNLRMRIYYLSGFCDEDSNESKLDNGKDN